MILKSLKCNIYSRMQRQKCMTQLSPEQLKQRQIGNEYLKIEEATQFLTQIIRYNPKSKRTLLKFIAMIDLKSFINIIVQKSYLLYTCLLHKCNILLSLQLFTKPLKKSDLVPLQQAYCEYLLEKDLYRHSQQEQEQLLKKFRLIDIQKSPQSYGEYLCGFIIKIKKKLAPHFERLKGTSQNYICSQMDGLISIIEGYLLPQIQKLSAKMVIVAFEESEIFREYSVLLKCLNSSLFTTMQINPKNKILFKELMQLEQYLLQESKQYQRANIKRIQETIQQCLKLLLRQGVVFSQQSINDSKSGKKESKPSNKNQYSLGAVEEEIAQMRKYSVKIFLKEKPISKFTPQTLENIMRKYNGQELIVKQQISQKEKDEKDQRQKLNRSEYVIQYFSWKNLISIKYITNIELNVQNTDILMYHCNYLTYNWNNVTLQFVEKTQGKTKRKQRFLAFKAITYITSQQKILFKIMAMIDLLMIHAKIAEPQLKKNIVNIDQYHLKSISLQKQCEHMKKVFISKIQKSYQVLQSTFLKSYI